MCARFVFQVMNVAKYKGPEALVEVMVELFPTNRHQVKILDAASGTGLCGEAVKRHSLLYLRKQSNITVTYKP